jgi:predicted protein tyrosine phosphatase
VSTLERIHHVCGLDELEVAPIHEADRLVSILDPDIAESPLARVGRPLLVLRFHDAIDPEAALVLPTVGDIQALLAFDAGAATGDRLVLHCTAGISRSTAALAILLAQRHPGNEDEIFSFIREIRPQAWPNSRMIEIADELLGLEGTLAAALRRHYIIQVGVDPTIGPAMQSLGRGREVPK